MSTETDIRERIGRAADAIAPAWPLHSFVTANPLAGFEDRPFHEAVSAGERLFGGAGYPDADTFRRAWESGRIDPEVLETELAAHGYEADPETLLDRMATRDGPTETTAETGAGTDRVDRILTKWLAAFLEQGKAHWPMPDREEGFYAAFRTVARHDHELPDRAADAPEDPLAAIEGVLADRPEDRWRSVFEHHLAALPGWTGFLKQRIADEGSWQSTYSITLEGYLAARLLLTDWLDAPVEPPTAEESDRQGVPLPEIWLSAWETTYREGLIDAVTDAGLPLPDGDDGRPDAQLVFCIDTRSEVIRRHVEAAGDYETHGYAGFFGVPMRYRGYGTDVTVDACPPILDAEHHVVDRPVGDDDRRDRHDHRTGVIAAGREVVEALKRNAATAFSFVESAGLWYGGLLAARTLLPAGVYDLLEAVDERVPADHEFCEPSVDHDPGADTELPAGFTLEQKVAYAAAAFESMGIEEFARVVAFVGHAGQTANNPFDASLDCGACAGNPGGPSARVLATICNDEAVREALRERGIGVPEDTVFVAGEHNTTTDEIRLFDADVPESHAEDIEALRGNLATAREGAAAERTESMDGGGVRETERRAADWAQPRPEWGLAGNAAFVVGPRALTADTDLDGRSFLHSYDWRTDPDGDALEAILTGPMVVTQWINCQYYFATVDTAAYGSGSKVTQNPVGNVGVYQGNGGDLMTGLPAQSVAAAADRPYHQPMRLSTVVHAPVERVTDVLSDHDHLAELLDNGWLSLTVLDPTQDGAAFGYAGEMEWETRRSRARTEAVATGADD